MIWIVKLIGQRVMSRFCAPASTKPRRNPITPSPALASPEPVSQGSNRDPIQKLERARDDLGGDDGRDGFRSRVHLREGGQQGFFGPRLWHQLQEHFSDDAQGAF